MERYFLYIKLGVFCLYLSAAYWISMNFPPLGMLFYPSLGSFCVILMLHEDFFLWRTILIGATVTSIIGSVLFFIYPSIFTFFVTAFIVLLLMEKFSWKAAPILAVGLIPFFSQPESVWVLPLSVLCSLIGITAPIWLVQKLDKKLSKKNLDEESYQEMSGM